MTIRPATRDDAAAVARIYNEGIEDRLATFETRPRSAEEVGEWFTDNEPSRAVHVAAGFEEVGIQRRHGRLDGRWKDCVLVERLLGDASV